MKKVLSVALASAMVLGMGANAFAISYNSGSNDKADWPDNFKFDGELFVTNKDGDIVEEASTELNDNESVNFEPGDVIWMPLYADDQYAWTNEWTEGTDDLDEVRNIKLDKNYFVEGQLASGMVDATTESVVESFTVTFNEGLKKGPNDGYIGSTKVSVNYDDTNKKIGLSISKADYEAIFGEKVAKDATYKEERVRVEKVEAGATSVSVNDAKIATLTIGGKNATVAKAAQLKEIPTTLEVVNGDNEKTERTVESAKAVVNGKTFVASKPADFDKLVSDVNAELTKMAKDGKSALIKDVTVTVNLKEVEGTDDEIGKPHIDNATNGDKVFVDYGHYTGNIDKNWSINLIEASTGVAELIEKAELYRATATDYASYSKYTDEIMPKAVYLKVTLKKEWKTADDETMKYYVYVAKNNGSTSDKTNEVWVSGTYENTDYEYVNFDWTNNANEAKLWKVRKGENGTAVFDFADKAFFTVKMYSEESMYLDLSTAYDKTIAGEMDVEADSFYKFDNENANFSRTGELVIVSDDDSLVPYSIEDGELVKVDAEYVENYAIAHTNTKVNGFVFKTKQLGNYVLATEEIDEEVEEPAKDEKPAEENKPAEEVKPDTKPNPETGAEDFVGLAVSLAVVSVAAAGALALKK